MSPNCFAHLIGIFGNAHYSARGSHVGDKNSTKPLSNFYGSEVQAAIYGSINSLQAKANLRNKSDNEDTNL